MAMTLSKKALKSVESMALDMARQAIKECAEVYGFSAEEAIQRLGANQVAVRSEVRSVVKKDKVEKVAKAAFPLPFSGVIREDCCQGVKSNRGLYSQCEKSQSSNTQFCNGCSKQASKNANGEPDYGLIANRGVDGWTDPKGQAPTSFVKVMKKLKLTEEAVLAEVCRLGASFDAEKHFAEEPAKESKRGRPKKAACSDTESSEGEKKRGRPKKAAKVVEIAPTEDLFATLVQEAKNAGEMSGEMVEEMSDLSDSDSESSSKKAKKSPAEKAAKTSEKAAKASEKEAAKAAAKAEKEAEALVKKAEKEAEALVKKAEKDAEALVKKAEKEAEVAAKKAAKEAEKVAAKAAKDAKPKEEKKKGSTSKKAIEAVVVVPQTPELVAEEEEEDDEPAVEVEKIVFESVTYLKSSNNVIYDLNTQDEIGVWNEAKKTIEFCEVESDSDEE